MTSTLRVKSLSSTLLCISFCLCGFWLHIWIDALDGVDDIFAIQEWVTCITHCKLVCSIVFVSDWFNTTYNAFLFKYPLHNTVSETLLWRFTEWLMSQYRHIYLMCRDLCSFGHMPFSLSTTTLSSFFFLTWLCMSFSLDSVCLYSSIILSKELSPT